MSSSSTPVSGKRRRRLMRFKNQPSSVVSETSVPKTLGVVEFAEARAAELESMASAVSKPTGTRRIFQTLPRHMRRRAMSHNSKRLPVRLRQAAEKEFEKQERTSNAARTSRKHRRRPSNLRSEFARRQRSVMWLDTHLWHAKRMHMGLHWGYRLAEAPCDKNVRATYRSTANGCLISDTSYVGCVELCGQKSSILATVSQLSRPQTGPSFASSQYTSGGYEGTVILYRRDGYPSSPIGPVSFMWLPRSGGGEFVQEPLAKRPCLSVSDEGDNTTGRVLQDRLWLWVHGAIWQEVWDELESAVQDSDHHVKFASLREEFARFRLCGPATQSLLQASLQCADISQFDLQSCQDEWWATSLEWLVQSEAAASQWAQLKHYHEVPPQAILGLVVHDPRLNLPQHRQPVASLAENSCSTAPGSLPKMWREQAIPLLWNEDVRCKVSSTKISEKKLNQRRGELCLSPDADSNNLSTSLIPLILSCQVNGVSGFGSGWDVVIPRSWAMPFWISFIYHGAHAGGLRELSRLALESGSLSFPTDWPDTRAGKEEALKDRTSQEEAYLRHPPSKRTDYLQLCVRTPFHCDWPQLIEQWSTTSSEDRFSCYVLRDVCVLNKLRRIVSELTLSRQQKKGKVMSLDNSLASLEQALAFDSRALVACRVTLSGRGCPENCATLCLPLPADWKIARSGEQTELVEKLAGRQTAVDMPCISDSSQTVRCSTSSPSRRLVGFVVRGGFSFRHGGGIATAFCSLVALLHWLRLVESDTAHKATLLVRNNNSTQYRFAQLTVMTDLC